MIFTRNVYNYTTNLSIYVSQENSPKKTSLNLKTRIIYDGFSKDFTNMVKYESGSYILKIN